MSEAPESSSNATEAPADVLLLVSTAPPDVAEALAHRLVEEHLAACVNLVPGVRSVYRWQGAVQDDPETVLLIKTVPDRVDAVRTRLLSLHPYEVPELLVLHPMGGHAPYLAWVQAATAGPEPEGPPR